MEANKMYKFKTEFCAELGIPSHQYNRKLTELLEWLTNFFDYEFHKGNPLKIYIKEIYGEYQPLPRKMPTQEKINEEKKNDYENFTKQALGDVYKPNSKRKIARDALVEFGYEKYSHTNEKAVSERFIKEPFEKYGETDGQSVWVFYSSYAPLPDAVLEDWREIMRESQIGELEASNAFYKYAEGEDISKEIGYFKKAKDKFLAKYGDIPINVKSWRLKQ